MKNSMEQQELDFARPNAGLKIIEREEAREIKCNSCGKTKKATTENFHQSRIKRGNNHEICKACVKKRNQKYCAQDHVKKANKERLRKWCEENKDRKNKNSREWKANNKEKVYEYNVKYMEKKESKKLRKIASRRRYWESPEIYRAKACAYDKRVRKANPKWQCMKEVKTYYQIAKLFNLEVDHIVPINSDIVCGLHCLDNFQLLTREENASKGNRFWPDMP